MNVKELKLWATKFYAMDNAQLMALGVKERYLAKVKPHLRSVIDKAGEIVSSTELNNKKLDIINNDIRNLVTWGVPGSDEVKSDKKEDVKFVDSSIPLSEEREVPSTTQPEEPKKTGWYSRK